MLEGDRSEDKPTKDSEREPAIEGGSASDKLPPTPAPPEPPQSPNNSAEPSQEPHQRRENTKFILEILGVVLLLVYTVFTALEWSQIRWTNRLTSQALQDSGTALDKTLLKLQGQIDAAGRQADNTQTLADRMKDQAGQTKIIANESTAQAGEATVAANAARSAAETAKVALHVSERAYLTVGLPTMNMADADAILPILNTGHIPSGAGVGIVHEATIEVAGPQAPSMRIIPTEAHWKHYDLSSIATTGLTMNIHVPLPSMKPDSITNGHQQVFIVGTLTYNDGFPDDPDQHWTFCFAQTLYTRTKDVQWLYCDPNLYLPEAIETDHYPNNEYHGPN